MPLTWVTLFHTNSLETATDYLESSQKLAESLWGCFGIQRSYR